MLLTPDYAAFTFAHCHAIIDAVFAIRRHTPFVDCCLFSFHYCHGATLLCHDRAMMILCLRYAITLFHFFDWLSPPFDYFALPTSFHAVTLALFHAMLSIFSFLPAIILARYRFRFRWFTLLCGDAMLIYLFRRRLSDKSRRRYAYSAAR